MTPTEEPIPELPSNAVALREPIPPPSLFGTNDPVAVIGKARAVADALKSVIKQQKLISNINGKEYPRCEAWTLLGTMLGVFPVLIWTRQIENGWEARVEARTRDGAVVGCAEAQCLSTERNWSNRDDFALRSMAQTRATAKCLRMPLGFVMTLSGFEATPAEEMTFERLDHVQTRPEHKNAPTPAPTHKTRPLATEEQRAKLVKLFESEGKDAVQRAWCFFVDLGAILPTESLADLPLRYVPVTAGEVRELGGLIAICNTEGKATRPSWITEVVARAEVVEDKHVTQTQEPPNNDDDQWFMDVIVPVPHKGERRDAYLKHPDTIGSLYEARHGQDEEATAARQRLFGFVHHYEPKGWQKRDGTPMPPSDSDLKFREALDAFADYFENNHPDEKL